MFSPGSVRLWDWERAGALHSLLSLADLLLFSGDVTGTSCTVALLTAPLL